LLGLLLSMACEVHQAEPRKVVVMHAASVTVSDGTLALAGQPDVLHFLERPLTAFVAGFVFDPEGRLFEETSLEDLALTWAAGVPSYETLPPHAVIGGRYTSADGTPSRCSVEAKLLSAPVADEGGWSWSIERQSHWGGPACGDEVSLVDATTVFTREADPYLLQVHTTPAGTLCLLFAGFFTFAPLMTVIVLGIAGR
jgi:hypothetical protein